MYIYIYMYIATGCVPEAVSGMVVAKQRRANLLGQLTSAGFPAGWKCLASGANNQRAINRQSAKRQYTYIYIHIY